MRKNRLLGVFLIAIVLMGCGLGEKLREYGVRVKPAVNSQLEADKPAEQEEIKPEASAEAPEMVDDSATCAANDTVRAAVSDADTSESASDQICKYQVDLTNIGSERVIVHLKKVLDKDGVGTESVWKNHATLDPGKTVTLRYRTTLLKESGIRYVEALEGIAAIETSDACINTFENDTDARQAISVPVTIPCPVE